MADDVATFGEDLELGEMLAILAIIGVGIYFAYKAYKYVASTDTGQGFFKGLLSLLGLGPRKPPCYKAEGCCTASTAASTGNAGCAGGKVAASEGCAEPACPPVAATGTACVGGGASGSY